MVKEILFILSGFCCLVGERTPLSPLLSHLGLEEPPERRTRGIPGRKTSYGQRQGGVTVFLPHLLPLSHRAGDLSIPSFNSEGMERKNKHQMTFVKSTQEPGTVGGKIKSEMARVLISTT